MRLVKTVIDGNDRIPDDNNKGSSVNRTGVVAGAGASDIIGLAGRDQS